MLREGVNHCISISLRDLLFVLQTVSKPKSKTLTWEIDFYRGTTGDISQQSAAVRTTPDIYIYSRVSHCYLSRAVLP